LQHNDPTKTLYILQTQLIESKIHMAVSTSINQVVQQIVELRHEMHQELSNLKDRMHREISGVKDSLTALEKDMSAVKERLGMRTQIRSELRNRFFDYGFKTSWIILAANVPGIIAFVVMLLHWA
jgi:uncharacterized protein YdaL